MTTPTGSSRRARSRALFFVALAAAGAVFSGCAPKPVCTVNGKPLSEAEFAKLCEETTQINPQSGSVGMQVLRRWVEATLLAEEARRQNVYPSEAELEARMDGYRKQAAFNGANLAEQLAMNGVKESTVRREMLETMVRDNIMLRGITVSGADIQKTFDQQKAQLTQPERGKISQITLDSEAKVKAARDDLASNTQFSLVASTHSSDPFREGGGRVPQDIVKGGQFPPGFPVPKQVIDAAFRLQAGEVSEPVKVGDKWYLVKLEEKTPAKAPTLDMFKEEIRQALRSSKAGTNPLLQEIQKSLLDSIKNAKVQVFRPEYQSLERQIQQAAAAGANMAAGGGAPGAVPGGAPAGAPGAPPAAPPGSPGSGAPPGAGAASPR